MDYFEGKRRNDIVRQEEAKGVVADSMDVRLALIARMDAGELTLAEVQAELARIKRTAGRQGLTTRAKVWSGR